MQVRDQYLSKFREVIAGLNEAQREAVEQLDGPMLAIAGPGTGKTRILAARIGQILLETDTAAHNILCLTFTDAAVVAMRERLLDFIGPEAYRVPIFTFHAFCNTVIQENLEYFGRAELEPLTDLERIALIRGMLLDLPPDHPLRAFKRDNLFYEQNLINLFRTMKSEGWDVAHMLHSIDTYLEDLPNREEYVYKKKTGNAEKGSLKFVQLQEESFKMEKLKAAVLLFDDYNEALKKQKRYDYEDMVLWVIDAFSRNPFLLRNYQERYLYVLVDEFQDTNGAQNDVLKYLISFWDNPNVFVVGDDDQAIYEFQGARLDNIVRFYQSYQDSIALVVLSENYRSSQKILDASTGLIDRNALRLIKQLQGLALSKNLLAQHADYAQLEFDPQILSFEHPLAEEVAIWKQIQAWADAGIPYNEMAVIYRKHEQAERLQLLLERSGIAVDTKKQVNALDSLPVQRLRRILEFIWLEHNKAQSGEPMLYEILHDECWGIALADLRRLSFYMAKFSLQEEQLNWLDVLQDTERLQLAGIRQPERFVQAGSSLYFWISKIQQWGLLKLLESVLNRSGMLQLSADGDDKIWDLKMLYSFFEFVRQESQRDAKFNLHKLLETIKNMERNRLSLPVFYNESAKRGVHFVTAHGAKGLEFRRVWIMACNEKAWNKKGGNHNRFKLPDTLILSQVEQDAEESARRLFYVGMTRAQEQLYISYALNDEADKPQNAAIFVHELIESTGLSVQHQQVSSADVLTARQYLLTETSSPSLELPPKEILDSLLENLSISATALDRYLRCPLEFYYLNVLRVPTGSSEFAAYGSAVHEAIEKLFRKAKVQKKKGFPSEKYFMQAFESGLRKQGTHLSRESYAEWFKIGQAVLPRYYRERVNQWELESFPEQRLARVECDGVPITGIIDKVEMSSGDSVRLIDYKTGSQDPKNLARPSDKSPYGGKYWRQMAFYRILYSLSKYNYYYIDGTFIDYVTPDDQGVFPLMEVKHSPDDIQLVRGLIKETWGKIMAHEFTNGCGKDDCNWCKLARIQSRESSLRHPDEEALDEMA
jgi:DNA helicase-2/ATP-dependent DNA helicase PcrA